MTLAKAAKNGLVEARSNLFPGLAVWGAALLVLCLYFSVPAVKDTLDWIADFRKKHDPLFTVIVFSIVGALVPYLISLFNSEKEERDSVPALLVKMAFWAANGCATKSLFMYLNELIGKENTPRNVAQKVVIDQFLYAPLLTVSLVTIVYLWCSKDLSIRRTREALEKKVFRYRFVETYIANLAIWLPAAIIMFSVPAGLSLIFAMMMLALWSVILAAMTQS